MPRQVYSCENVTYIICTRANACDVRIDLYVEMVTNKQYEFVKFKVQLLATNLLTYLPPLLSEDNIAVAEVSTIYK